MGRMRSALSNPLELVKQIDVEIEHRIQQLIRQGELAEEEAHRWREKLIPQDERNVRKTVMDEEQFQRMLDEQGVPTRTELDRLSEQLELLVNKLDDLDEHQASQK